VKVTTSYGPAKPHRVLTNASPMNFVTETASANAVECSSKLQSEASFASEASVASVRGSVMTGNAWTVEQQPIIISPSIHNGPEDIDNEEAEDCLSLAATNSTETLFSLKISWDYFRELGTFPSSKALIANGHSRKGSSGSSNCSELGTTMKELFGPIRLYECTVPLASSETLSEISSMGSRASFNIMKDRSPLTRLKLSKNLSLRIHENGGPSDLMMNGSGKSHQRSFSCVYPEGRKSSSHNLFATLNGGSNCSSKLENNSFNTSKEDFHIPMVTTTSVENGSSHYTMEEEECMSNEGSPGKRGDSDREEEGSQKEESDENISREEVSESRSPLHPGVSDSDGINYSYSQSEHYLCEEYSPVYPVFSVLTEYGAPTPNSTHYNYSSQSPLGSTPSVHSDNGNDEGAFYL
jgi:hypothetical protein